MRGEHKWGSFKGSIRMARGFGGSARLCWTDDPGITTPDHPMLDAMTSLAFSVYSGKGTHAILVGSGISRTSGIPTGWEIILDLIRKVAAIEGKECGEDPAAWYKE